MVCGQKNLIGGNDRLVEGGGIGIWGFEEGQRSWDYDGDLILSVEVGYRSGNVGRV